MNFFIRFLFVCVVSNPPTIQPNLVTTQTTNDDFDENDDSEEAITDYNNNNNNNIINVVDKCK